MFFKKYLSLMVFTMLSIGLVNTAPTCRTEKSCVNNPKCQCYCSVKCGFRDKVEEDSPVWVENDPNGKYCYCKEWDLNHYEDCTKDHRLEE